MRMSKIFSTFEANFIKVNMESVIFKRKAYQKLLEWKRDSAGKTALLIEGARRIGKSTLVEQFAKKE